MGSDGFRTFGSAKSVNAFVEDGRDAISKRTQPVLWHRFLEEPGTWIRRSVAGEMLSLRHVVTIESVRNATSSDEHVQSVPGKHFAELMQPKKRRRLAMSQDEDWPPLTLLRLPGKNILALQCDHGEKDSPFPEAGPFLTGLTERPPITLHDSGRSGEHKDALARSVQKALLDAGGAWAQDHWQLLQAHGGGPLAVGLGSNMGGGRGKRPRAARLALVIVCRLGLTGRNESRHGGEEKWAPLNKVIDRAQRLFAGAGAAPGP